MNNTTDRPLKKRPFKTLSIALVLLQLIVVSFANGTPHVSAAVGQYGGIGLPFPAGLQRAVTNAGNEHDGNGRHAIDFNLVNENVLAIHGGTVDSTGTDVGDGNVYIVIDHGDNYCSLYYHLSSIAITAGEEVNRGQIIATSGETGRATGPHLHLAVTRKGSGNGCSRSHSDEVAMLFDEVPERELVASDPIISQNIPVLGVDAIEIGSYVILMGEDHPYAAAYPDPTDEETVPVAWGDVARVLDGTITLEDDTVLRQVQFLGGIYNLHELPIKAEEAYAYDHTIWVKASDLAVLVPTYDDVSYENPFFGYITMLTSSERLPQLHTTFNPTATVDRGILAWYIVNMAGLSIDTSCESFPDVQPSDPYFEEITTLKCLGIINGFSDGHYHSERMVNREQLSKFITNTLGSLGAFSDVESCGATETQFSDVPTDNPFYDYILCVKRLRIVTGFDDGTFRGSELVTKEQLAKFMTSGRSLLYYSRQSGLIELTVTPGDVTTAQIGDLVPFQVNVLRARNLHTMNLTCFADSKALTPDSVGFGEFFPPEDTQVLSRVSRRYINAALRIRGHEAPITGTSEDDFAILLFMAKRPGDISITCEANFFDADGLEIPAYSPNNVSTVTVMR